MRNTWIPMLAAFCLASLLTSGCRNPFRSREIQTGTVGSREVQVFDRRPGLVDLAVLESGAAPGAIKEEKRRGRVAEFTANCGRVLTVTGLEGNSRAKITITHRGHHGKEGAQRAMKLIEEWMQDTDAYQDSIPERGSSLRPIVH